MSAERPTLLDLFLQKDADPVVGLIDEAARLVPEVSGQTMARGQLVTIPNVGAARTIKGRTFKTCVRVALPDAPFRNENEGVDATKSRYERRTVETFTMNPRWECDIAIARSHEDGPEAFIASEAQAILTSAIMGLGRQFYYGRSASADTKGHPGLVDVIQSAYTVDATGTTDNTASSVWAVKWGPQAVQWMFGQNGDLQVEPARLESITDADGKRFTAYVQELLAFCGLQVARVDCLGRIKNLTAQNGKTLEDDMLSDLLSKFPVGMRPDCLFMSRRSLAQLQKSRTATNATGAPAPFPTEYEGVPIVPTDSLLDTEAIG